MADGGPEDASAVKRKRGRPRKTDQPALASADVGKSIVIANGRPEGASSMKRKRGRPRKTDQLALALADAGIVPPATTTVVTPATSTVVEVPQDSDVLKEEPQPKKLKEKGEATGLIGVYINLAGETDQLAFASVDGGIVTTATPTVVGVPLLKAEPKPKPKTLKKGKGKVIEPIGVDMNLVGKTVTGVLEVPFDTGYLLTVRVGDSDNILCGVVFGTRDSSATLGDK